MALFLKGVAIFFYSLVAVPRSAVPLTLKAAEFSVSAGKLLNIKFMFWFLLQGRTETFLVIGRTERDTKKKMYNLSN